MRFGSRIVHRFGSTASPVRADRGPRPSSVAVSGGIDR
jgi:hypothetical protein